MNRRLIVLIFISLLTAIVSLSTVYVLSIRDKATDLLQILQEEQFSRVEANIQAVDQLVRLVDDEIEKEGRRAMEQLIKANPDPDLISGLSSSEMKERAKRYGLDEIYLIDEDQMIINSSYAPDIGMDLSTYDRKLSSFIQKIYGSDTILDQSIAISWVERSMNKYFYWSPPPGRYIFEGSISVKRYVSRNHGEELYESLFQNLYKQERKTSSFFLDARLYQLIGDKLLALDQGNSEFIDRFSVMERIKKQEAVEFRENSHFYRYVRFTPQDQEEASFTHPFVLETKIDFNPFLDIIRSLISTSILIAAAVFLFTWFFIRRFLKKHLSYPLEMLQKSLKEIERGKTPYPHCKNTSEFHAIEDTMISMAKVITKRNLELKTTRNYFRNLIDFMPSAIITVDDDRKIIGVNKTARSFFSYRSKRLIGRRLCSVFPEIASSLMEELEKHPQLLEFDLEEGKRFMQLSFYSVQGNSSETVFRFDDITEMTKKDEQLRQAQRMDTIGNMAGGLAHDFNNILGGINGTVSLMKLDIETEELPNVNQQYRQLQTISDSIASAAEIVGRMLSLSRGSQHQNVDFDLNTLTVRTVELLRGSADKSIVIEVNTVQENAVCTGSPSQIEQLILNLGINSVHAMTSMRPDHHSYGGWLEYSIQKVQLPESFLMAKPDLDSGPYWLLKVCDNGVGIPESIREKIFDPFFSTKKGSRGTGLGLTMVYNIVQQHRGVIDIESLEGKGSCFLIYLPASQAELPIPKQVRQTSSSEQIIKGSGEILFVDDEKLIRSTAREMLKLCGYTVTCASSGDEALSMLAAGDYTPNLVIMDMIMPGKSGLTALREIKQHYPQLPVILSSGNREDERISIGIQRGAADFIAKPYSLAELSEKTSAVLKG